MAKSPILRECSTVPNWLREILAFCALPRIIAILAIAVAIGIAVAIQIGNRKPTSLERKLTGISSQLGMSFIGQTMSYSVHAGRTNRLLFTIFFVSPLVTSVAPRLTPLFFALVSIALIGAALRRGVGWRQLLPHGRALQALAVWLLLAAYVCFNATWSVERIDGFGKGAMLAALAVLSFAAVVAALVLDKRILVRAGLFFAAGAFLGGVFILIELLTDGIMTRALMTWVPLLQPSAAKRIKVAQGDVIRMNLSELNSNVSLAMFHLWPGLLVLLALEGARRTVATTVFFVTLATAVALSEHGSSQMALIGSGLVVLAARRWPPRAVIRALAVAWCAAFVLVIPASLIAYQSGLHLATWLPKTARHRVILWEATAEQTLAHPLLGVGVKSTSALTARQKAAAPPDQPEGFVAPRRTGHHAHNIFLHAIYELGVLGAVLFAIAGAAVVMLILYLPAAAQPFAAGTFAAFALVGAFAWGMWQTWFMCVAALLPLYLRIGATACDSAQQLRAVSSLPQNGDERGLLTVIKRYVSGGRLPLLRFCIVNIGISELRQAPATGNVGVESCGGRRLENFRAPL
jgi:hypothetical protein